MDPVRPLTFWRQVAALRAEPFAGVPDAQLLERYATTADEAAFEEITRRHGGMVWAVCRQMLPRPADAEDAFQAVFLAFVQSAGRVKNGNVGAWLHGTAVRGALKFRRAAVRSRQRDQKTARPEANLSAAAGDWNELLAAVHEEVGRLPETLRTAFVACDLEGVPQPDAAARLGWKPGTLTGRLSKARKRLLAALTKRGLAPSATLGLLGLGAATSSAGVPVKLLMTVLHYPTAAPGAIPATLAALALEIAPMTVPKVKLLALAAMLTCGLAAGTGTVLVPALDAQGPPTATPAVPPPTSSKPPAADATKTPPPMPAGPSTTTFGDTASTEVLYRYIPRRIVAGNLPNFDTVAGFIRDSSRDGWEFAGTFNAKVTEDDYERLNNMPALPGASSSFIDCSVMVFKKHRGAAPPTAVTVDGTGKITVEGPGSLTLNSTALTPTVPKPVVCTTAFTVTETPSYGVTVTYSYKPGEHIAPQHLRYAGKNATTTTLSVPVPTQAKPVTPANEPASVSFNPLALTSTTPAGSIPPAAPVSDPVVIELKVIDAATVMQLGRKLLPKSAELFALPTTNSVVVLNATADDVAKLKKLLALIDVQAKAKPQYYPPESVLPLGAPAGLPGMPLGLPGMPSAVPSSDLPQPNPLTSPVPNYPQVGPAPEPAPKPAKKPKANPPAGDPNERLDTTPAKKSKAKPPAGEPAEPSHMTPERIHGGIM